MTDEELWELRCIRRRVGCIMLCLALPLLPAILVAVAWLMAAAQLPRR